MHLQVNLQSFLFNMVLLFQSIIYNFKEVDVNRTKGGKKSLRSGNLSTETLCESIREVCSGVISH